MRGVKVIKFPKHVSLFFQKTRIKSSILTYVGNNLQHLQILSKFLSLNGINIVVVINSWV